LNFFDFKDGADFLQKTGMTPDQALEFLDRELQMRRGINGK